MLQFIGHCCIESNPGGCSNSYTGYYTLQAYKVQRYIKLFVELVSDVEGFISERTHTASTIQTLRIPRLTRDHLGSAQATWERCWAGRRLPFLSCRGAH